jgi:hypothetical protein
MLNWSTQLMSKIRIYIYLLEVQHRFKRIYVMCTVFNGILPFLTVLAMVNLRSVISVEYELKFHYV